MATQNVLPAQAALTIRVCLDLEKQPPTQLRIKPVNADGSYHDCTGINNATLTMQADPLNTLSPVKSYTLTVVSADAEGLVLDTVADYMDWFKDLGSTTGVFDVMVSVGITYANAILAAVGNYQIMFLP